MVIYKHYATSGKIQTTFCCFHSLSDPAFFASNLARAAIRAFSLRSVNVSSFFLPPRHEPNNGTLEPESCEPKVTPEPENAGVEILSFFLSLPYT
mmetsp:Transcript_13737/g.20711  ORF Transcript_13737/g.20711 Transcript_13737/m.20711 type:complete len:95 (+) Transcript_13737:1905-2189(+)